VAQLAGRQRLGRLKAAHENGVVHRDLKPANMMLDPDGNVKLLDFGLAKPTGNTDKSVELTASPTVIEATRHGVIMGTASYMSPEQARGRAVDKRSDIWAWGWGSVVYEMLTGHRLFAGDSTSDIIAAVLREGIDLGELPADTPAPHSRTRGRTLARVPRIWMAASALGPYGAREVASLDGAWFLGAQDDVLELDSNPPDDIRNAPGIHYVIQAGVVRDGMTLDEVGPTEAPYGDPHWYEPGIWLDDVRATGSWGRRAPLNRLLHQVHR
jgi:serine/threonine protein kinase